MKETVLVIDDYKSYVQSFNMLLGHLGYNIGTLDTANINKNDLILLDDLADTSNIKPFLDYLLVASDADMEKYKPLIDQKAKELRDKVTQSYSKGIAVLFYLRNVLGFEKDICMMVFGLKSAPSNLTGLYKKFRANYVIEKPYDSLDFIENALPLLLSKPNHSA